MWWKVMNICNSKLLSFGAIPVFCKSSEIYHHGPIQTDEINNQNLELLQVQIFFRHGARTPLHLLDMKDSIPKDMWEPHLILNRSLSFCKFPYKLVDLQGKQLKSSDMSKLENYYQTMQLNGGTTVGQLTRQGHEQMFQLGQKYKRRYRDQTNFISSDQNLEETVYLRSSRVNRNIFSLQCVLAGLFGDLDFSQHQNVLKIHSEKSEHEIFYPNSRHCKAQGKILKEGKEKLECHEEIKKAEAYLKENLGVSQLWSKLRNKKCSLHSIRDVFVSRQYHGFVIPKEISDYLPKLSKLVCEEIIYELFGGPLPENIAALRTNVGPVLDMLINRFETVISGGSKTKLCLYATHDSLIIPLLVFLEAFDYEYPGYGDNLIFELYKDSITGQYWIQILYNFEAIQFDGGKKIGKCFYVPLEKFFSSVKKYALSYDLYRQKCEEVNAKDRTIQNEIAGL